MRVALIGAGLMGHGLALVFALGGHAVRITDSDSAALERVPTLIGSALETLQQGGEVDASWTPERLDKAVQRCATLDETVAEADLVIEAISEKPEAKRAFFARLDPILPDGAILASNTSHLDVFQLVPE